MTNFSLYGRQLQELVSSALVNISTIRPSQWAEENIIMGKPFPGPLRYSRTPYTREIIDCFAPDHPAKEIVFMKGAQFGGTATIIVPLIGYLIQHNPGNIIMTVGHDDLIEEAMNKVDLMLDGTGLRKLIRPMAQRIRANKSGDTNTGKEFSGGYLKIRSAGNHKIWRQADYQIGLIDDYEAIRSASKESGSTYELIMQRFAAYADKRKVFFCSTPELAESSNIEPVFLMGDQRKYYLPCPCCKKYIELKWTVPLVGGGGDMGGITWKQDEDGIVISESVGYICQLCGDFFNDSNKSKLLNKGHWEPTAKPKKLGTYSYHASALYAPPGMYDWEHYVNQWIAANPVGRNPIEAKLKSFYNLCLAETFKVKGEAPSANQLQRNVRPYQIGVVPEKLSVQDGNGEIVMLTCAIDMNGTIANEERGTVDDARLDYEVLAWSESGAVYSVTHGSIGTFIPLENTKKFKEDRVRWSYDHNSPNSVWPELDKVLDASYVKDSGGVMRILSSVLDSGHYTAYAYHYIDRRGSGIVAVKGDKEDAYVKLGADAKKFKRALERNKLYILKVGLYKDELSEHMLLKSDFIKGESQPPGFCNYPEPGQGKYGFENYFEHYQSEERKLVTKDGEGVASIWKKKSSRHQNHFWDVRIYNMAAKDIIVDRVCRHLGIPNYIWSDFVREVMGR